MTEVTGTALAPPVRPSPAALVIRIADMDGVLDHRSRLTACIQILLFEFP